MAGADWGSLVGLETRCLCEAVQPRARQGSRRTVQLATRRDGRLVVTCSEWLDSFAVIFSEEMDWVLCSSSQDASFLESVGVEASRFRDLDVGEWRPDQEKSTTLRGSNRNSSIRPTRGKGLAESGSRARPAALTEDETETLESERSTEDEVKSGPSKAEAVEDSLEYRLDPEDGKYYTFPEILSYYSDEFEDSAVRSYWRSLGKREKRCKGRLESTLEARPRRSRQAEAETWSREPKLKARPKTEPSWKKAQSVAARSALPPEHPRGGLYASPEIDRFRRAAGLKGCLLQTCPELAGLKTPFRKEWRTGRGGSALEDEQFRIYAARDAALTLLLSERLKSSRPHSDEVAEVLEIGEGTWVDAQDALASLRRWLPPPLSTVAVDFEEVN